MSHSRVSMAPVVVPALLALAGAEGAASAAEVVFREVSLHTPDGQFAAVDMADLDRDGRAEIISGRRDGEEGLWIFSRRRTGWKKKAIRGDGEYGGVEFADVTGDGIPDVVGVRTKGSSKGVEIHRTRLQGGKMLFELLPSPYDAGGCDDLQVGDIESDGDLDIVVSTGGQGLKVLLNEGGARSFRVLTLETGNYEDTGITLGDADGDKRLDVLAANHPGKNPKLFRCAASGAVTYDEGHGEGLTTGRSFSSWLHDWTGDGHTDLAVGTAGGLRMWAGSGCRGPSTGWWRELSLPDRGEQVMQIAAGDVDGDGRQDVAFATSSGIRLLAGAPGGAFTRMAASGLPERGEFSGCCLFDQDGDGDPDLATGSLQGGGVRFFENLRVESP